MIKAGYTIGHVSRRSAGVWEAVAAMSEALNRQQGIRISIFGLKAPDTRELLQKYEGAQIITAPVVGPQAFGYSPKLEKKIRNAELDLLHTHGIWMYSSKLSRDWARRTKKPHLVSPHGMLDPWALANRRWRKNIVENLYERSHLREVSCLHALCIAELEAIRNYGLNNPVCVIPNGVEIPKTLVSEKPPWETFADGRRILLYLGRIHPKKGLPLLLRGFAKVDGRRGWCLVIAGWDQLGHKEELRNMAKSLGIDKDVAFLGPLFGVEKASAFANADAYVLPSLSEGLPMTVLEAWAFRLPVLMTPECHLPDGNKQGAAIEVAATVEGLVIGLRQLIEMSDDERKEMGRRGLSLVEERYTWPKVAKRMRGVYEWLLGGGQKPEDIYVVSNRS